MRSVFCIEKDFFSRLESLLWNASFSLFQHSLLFQFLSKERNGTLVQIIFTRNMPMITSFVYFYIKINCILCLLYKKQQEYYVVIGMNMNMDWDVNEMQINCLRIYTCVNASNLYVFWFIFKFVVNFHGRWWPDYFFFE